MRGEANEGEVAVKNASALRQSAGLKSSAMNRVLYAHGLGMRSILAISGDTMRAACVRKHFQGNVYQQPFLEFLAARDAAGQSPQEKRIQ